jgi:iron complex transport system ATP-binding protein
VSLSLKNIHLKLGKKHVLNGISCEFAPSSFTAVIGPNGAGKTTLLKSIASLLPYEGSVGFNGRCLKQNGLKNSAKIVAYMSQFQEAPELTTYELLTLGRRPYANFALSANDKAIIEKYADELGIKHYFETKIANLSGGERQKIYLAKALVQQPKILLLDEPISHLDPKNQLEILEAVKKATIKNNLITVSVMHDLQNALHFSDTLLMLKEGSVLHRCQTALVNEQMLNDLFNIQCEIFHRQGHPFVHLSHKHLSTATVHTH